MPSETVVLPGEHPYPFVYLDNELVIFGGVCEGIDNEVYYLRFEMDWIDMLDINVIAARKKIGDNISFAANYRSVGIYPYNL